MAILLKEGRLSSGLFQVTLTQGKERKFATWPWMTRGKERFLLERQDIVDATTVIVPDQARLIIFEPQQGWRIDILGERNGGRVNALPLVDQDEWIMTRLQGLTVVALMPELLQQLEIFA